MRYLFNYLYAASAAFLILISVTGCDSPESRAQSENGRNHARAVKVSVVEVKPVHIQDILVLPGGTEAWQDVRVAADTSGRIDWIGPGEGEMVHKEQILVKIDVSALEAALDRAEASFKLANDLYQRRQGLFERKIITREELDRSLTEQILAKGNLRQAKIEYERGFLRSPVSGIVNHFFVDEGEFIDRGKPVVDLVNVDRIKINVNVHELDVRHILAGHRATVKIDAYPDRVLSGIVDFVAYKADPATKTFLVRVMIQNPNHEIRPGMIARVAFLRRIIPEALVAPLFAIVDKGGERLLFVEKDGVAQAHTVSFGIIQGDQVKITSGLNAGDHLIVTGQTKVEEGMKVQVR